MGGAEGFQIEGKLLETGGERGGPSGFAAAAKQNIEGE
jgi:hypothetical protein